MVREWSESFPRIGIIGATGDDARDIMVEGVSGILSCFPPDRPARYIGNRRRVEFPSGAIGTLFTAEEPDRLRGPQHHKLWADEIASWKDPDAAWDMATLGLRLGDDPQAVITGTPRPIPLLKGLRDRSFLASDPLGRVVMTEGATRENERNLAASFIGELMTKYEGSRLGRQELDAEILEDVQGAIWHRGMIEVTRVQAAPAMTRVVVAIDPSATSTESADECGIIVGGMTTGLVSHGYVIEDGSLRASPQVWAEQAIALYRRHKADRIIAETNNGGEMVGQIIRSIDPNVPYSAVTASRGKATRAEPIAALYEQGRVHHVGRFDLLEDQQCSWVPGDKSPDRMDALVWCMTELLISANPWAGLTSAGGVA